VDGKTGEQAVHMGVIQETAVLVIDVEVALPKEHGILLFELFT